MDVFCYPQPIVFDKLTSSVKQIETIVLELPEINTSFKAYMDYRTITDEKSLQWEMQQKAYTDEFGLRKIGERYCVAVGTYYAEQCGKVLLITLDDGTQFEVIVSDIKNNIHTDKKNMYTPIDSENGNLLEFIVDTKKLSKEVRKLGDVSPLQMIGAIKNIEEIVDDNN